MVRNPSPSPKDDLIQLRLALYTLSDLARLFGVCKRTVHRWRQQGILPEPKLAMSSRVVPRWTRSQIKAFVDGMDAPSGRVDRHEEKGGQP
jgi:transposase-like protein